MEEEGEQEGMEWQEERKWLGSRRLEGGEELLDRVEAEEAEANHHGSDLSRRELGEVECGHSRGDLGGCDCTHHAEGQLEVAVRCGIGSRARSVHREEAEEDCTQRLSCVASSPGGGVRQVPEVVDDAVAQAGAEQRT